MNGNKLISDTNVLIYLFKGEEKAATVLNDKMVYLSVITEFELLSFKELTSSEISKIKHFISDCIIVDINSYIKELTIELRKNYNLKIPDAIICASAIFFKYAIDKFR